MVNKLAQLLHTKVRGLHEAAYLLGGFALLSQLTALVRDRLFAHQFGAGATLDIYYAAFKIPDLLFVSIASLVSIYVLIPFITESLEKHGHKTRELLDSVFTCFAVMLIGVSAVVFLFAPTLLSLLFPEFMQGEHARDLVVLTRILLLQPFLLGISNLVASITQIKGRFVLYAASPLLYNLGIIIGAVFIYPEVGPPGLAMGVVLGAFLHLLIQVPFVFKEGLLPSVTFAPNFSLVKKVMLVSLPRTLTLAMGQITLVALIAMGSSLIIGSVAVFQLALNLQSVPLAIIGVSYSVAAFPTLAKLFSSGKKNEFVMQMRNAARHILFWSIPAVVMVVVLRAQLVRVILGSGEFDWSDTRLTAAALALFVLSLAAQALVLLLVRGYYAAGNTQKPLFINIASSLVAIGSAYVLLLVFTANPDFRAFVEILLRVEHIPGTEVLMLPLGYSIGMLLNAIVLTKLFARDHGPLGTVLRPVFWKTSLAAVFGGAIAHRVLAVINAFVDINTFWGIFIQGLGAGIAGIVAMILALIIVRSAELEETWRALHHKFWKTKTVMPEGSEVE